MTKTQLEQLKVTQNVLDSLEKFNSEHNVDTGYKNALAFAASEYSFMMERIEKLMPGILIHPFWNDELAKVVQSDKTDKERDYLVNIEQDSINGDYTLSISSLDDNTADDLENEYTYYTTKEQAEEDVDELENLGYNIKHNY